MDGDVAKIVSVAIYGFTLVLLYSTSTVYHSVRGRAKAIMQKLDHLSIYLLIAGSYTPFCLVTLRGAWGWWLFGTVWTLAVIGMLQEIKPRSEARVLSIVIYAVMGWIVLVAVKPLLAALGTAGFAWLVAGGVSYTAGIVFFAYDERFRHWHGIWSAACCTSWRSCATWSDACLIDRPPQPVAQSSCMRLTCCARRMVSCSSSCSISPSSSRARSRPGRVSSERYRSMI